MTLACLVTLAFALGLVAGRWSRRSELRALRADVEAFRELSTELHTENCQLRLNTLPFRRPQ